ncbi:MAG: methyltransferase domain-containing protein [Gammaproteobacteria bacterium]|nr:methyltransferase domain-containing protein [Gammaproteobacteria bacterium]
MKLSPYQKDVAALFDRLSSVYDGAATRFFPFCADRMAYRFPPGRDSKVLDIATGTGALALSLAQNMGRGNGRVIGIDFSPGMLDVAYHNMRRLALQNVDLHEMDASKLEFRDNYFDAVYCSFGLFFIEDMQAALEEWRRVTCSQGRLVLSCFVKGAFQPMGALLSARFEALGVKLAGENGTYTWDRLATAEQCEKLLQQAGWSQIEVHQEQCGYHLMKVDEWWDVIWNTGFRRYLEQLTEQQLEQLKVDHLAELEPLMTEKGLWLDVPVHFVSAVR